MTRSLTDRLCTKCGLCCDGSLFADVELAGSAEVDGLEAMGLEVEDDDGGLLPLPCVALRGKRCDIYAHRPETCRTFECRLLLDVRHGSLDVEEAEAVIADATAKTARLRKLARELSPSGERVSLLELCGEALSTDAPAGTAAAVLRKRAEIESGMAAVESLIRKRFLAEAKRGRGKPAK